MANKSETRNMKTICCIVLRLYAQLTELFSNSIVRLLRALT